MVNLTATLYSLQVENGEVRQPHHALGQSVAAVMFDIVGTAKREPPPTGYKELFLAITT